MFMPNNRFRSATWN